ncbi:MAG: hypothetical protein ACKVQQ_02190 [Burkholderiales bacterium]
MARRARSAWWGRLLGVAFAAGFLALIYFVGQSFMGKSEKPKKYVPQISLIKPPAPPPPPKEDKPPPPQPKREEVKVEQPREAPTPQAGQPAGKDLGVDADGAGAGDGFGLVGKRGGTDLLASGSGGAGAPATTAVNRAQFAFFTNSAQQVLHDEIKRRLGEKTRNRDFRANYSIWLDPDGSIRRFELTPTGNPEVDGDLKNALAEVRSLKLAPPADMPQPLRFLFTSRASG